MSLKAFHLLFVSLSILLCLFVGIWALLEWKSEGARELLLLGCGSLLAGAGLGVYGRYVLKKLRGMSYL